jgi:HEAT repeat protein
MWRPTDEEVSELIATYAGLHEEPSKRFCQSVLADARSPSAIEVQLDGAQSPNQKLRDVALRGLSGQCRPEAVDRLLPALDRADAGVAKVILRALGEIGDPRALDAIGLKLADPSDDVVGFAIRALGTLGHRGAIPWLIPLLEKPAVSLAAAMALYALGNRSGIPFLRATMESDKQETRTKAIEALAQGVDEIDRRLLSRDLDGLDPWSDPRSPITHIRVTKASKSLGLPESEIRSRFEAMADLCCLTLEWLPAPEQL